MSSGREITNLNGLSLNPPADKHELFVQTLSEAQVDFLLQRTPKHEIKMRQGRGGMQFAYVEHGYVTERLNLVFGFNWDFEIVDKQILDDEVIVEAKITVRTPGGQTIVKSQFGGAEIKRHASGPKGGRPLSIADDYKAAASDALKKCASLLGVGLDLYGRDRPDDSNPDQPARDTRKQKNAQIGVTDVSEIIEAEKGQRTGMATRAQLTEIRHLAALANMDLVELCEKMGLEDLAALTEARAVRVLTRLRQLADESAQDLAS